MSGSATVDRGFSGTRWSAVSLASVTGAFTPAQALAALCARHRYPVYALLRHLGHAPARAFGIASAFLEGTQRSAAAEVPPAVPRFRQFLLARLEEYLAREPASTTERIVDDADALVALEARYAQDAGRHDVPTQAFKRAFAVDVLLHALARLREEAQAAGHDAMYAALVPFLAREPEPHEREALARALGAKPSIIATALDRLRRRLHELASEYLADTVSSSDELAGEQAEMFAALGGSG